MLFIFTEFETTQTLDKLDKIFIKKMKVKVKKDWKEIAVNMYKLTEPPSNHQKLFKFLSPSWRSK